MLCFWIQKDEERWKVCWLLILFQLAVFQMTCYIFKLPLLPTMSHTQTLLLVNEGKRYHLKKKAFFILLLNHNQLKTDGLTWRKC